MACQMAADVERGADVSFMHEPPHLSVTRGDTSVPRMKPHSHLNKFLFNFELNVVTVTSLFANLELNVEKKLVAIFLDR